MKMIIVAGTPGSGKTSVLTFVLKHILQKGMHPSAAKIDCLYTNDHLQFEKNRGSNNCWIVKRYVPRPFFDLQHGRNA